MRIKCITNEEINELPKESYSGTIILVDDEYKLKTAIEEIYQDKLLGIDTESKPVFKKGVIGRISLIQIAGSKAVYLFRSINQQFPKEVISIISNRKHLKVGIDIGKDFKDLKKQVDLEARNFIDLNKMAKELGFESIGAKKLTALLLGFKLSKRMQISNWEAELLSPSQILYAATDAWVCRNIYLKLEELSLTTEL